MAILISYPWLALVAAGVFAILWRATRRTGVGLVALLWVGYAVYEYLVQARVLCTGECNIRIDLLLVYPALALLSAAAVIMAIRARRRSGAAV